jgi:DNA-binding MarR family transcriptional regulator
MAQSRKASSEKTPVVALRKVPAVALTIGRPEMLVDGSDQKFRRLVQGVFTFAAVHEAIRDSYVQYTILQIIRHFGTDEEMSIGDIAGQLRLSGSFITNETKKLEILGLVEKRQSKADRRKILLTVSKKGAQLLDNLAPLQRKVNDVQFAGLSRDQFLQLLAMLEQLTDSSQAALTLLHYLKRAEPQAMPEPDLPRRGAKSKQR